MGFFFVLDGMLTPHRFSENDLRSIIYIVIFENCLPELWQFKKTSKHIIVLTFLDPFKLIKIEYYNNNNNDKA